MNTPQIVGDSPWFDNERSWLDAESSAARCQKFHDLMPKVMWLEAECSVAGNGKSLPGLILKVPRLDDARCL